MPKGELLIFCKDKNGIKPFYKKVSTFLTLEPGRVDTLQNRGEMDTKGFTNCKARPLTISFSKKLK
jgi:hypothetical protein